MVAEGGGVVHCLIVELPINLSCPVYINKYGANEGLIPTRGSEEVPQITSSAIRLADRI